MSVCLFLKSYFESVRVDILIFGLHQECKGIWWLSSKLAATFVAQHMIASSSDGVYSLVVREDQIGLCLEVNWEYD